MSKGSSSRGRIGSGAEPPFSKHRARSKRSVVQSLTNGVLLTDIERPFDLKCSLIYQVDRTFSDIPLDFCYPPHESRIELRTNGVNAGKLYWEEPSSWLSCKNDLFGRAPPKTSGYDSNNQSQLAATENNDS